MSVLTRNPPPRLLVQLMSQSATLRPQSQIPGHLLVIQSNIQFLFLSGTLLLLLRPLPLHTRSKLYVLCSLNKLEDLTCKPSFAHF